MASPPTSPRRRFPRSRLLDDFDFAANPAFNPALIGQLATGDWVRQGRPLCPIRYSGTAKTHLLIALGTAAAERGYSARYVLAAKLVNGLAEAADERHLARTIVRYGRAVDLDRRTRLPPA